METQEHKTACLWEIASAQLNLEKSPAQALRLPLKNVVEILARYLEVYVQGKTCTHEAGKLTGKQRYQIIV